MLYASPRPILVLRPILLIHIYTHLFWYNAMPCMQEELPGSSDQLQIPRYIYSRTRWTTKQCVRDAFGGPDIGKDIGCSVHGGERGVDDSPHRMLECEGCRCTSSYRILHRQCSGRDFFRWRILQGTRSQTPGP